MNPNSPTLEVLFTPADFTAQAGRDLSGTICVVFDIFRATTTIVTALANGAAAIVPVAEIDEALAVRRERPEVLLAGERDGLRISAAISGGVDFDLGNSPREFTRERVQSRTIVLSTTNGSRALRACAKARETLAGSFRNLAATANYLKSTTADRVVLVCSGTGRQAAFEDVLGAGALASLIWPARADQAADSAQMARQIYELHRGDLLAAVACSRNGRRLLGMPDLRDDVPWCLERDVFSGVAKMTGTGSIGVIGTGDGAA